MNSSTPKDERDKQARVLALLGLALDPQPPSGAQPDLMELDLLRRGELPEPRRAEVAAWVAQDPAAVAELAALEASEAWLARNATAETSARAAAGEPPGRTDDPSLRERLRSLLVGLTDWQPGPALAMAATVAFVAVLTLPLLRPPGLDERIDDQYAGWDYAQVPDPAAWPWTPDRLTKGPGFWADPVAPELTPERQAFQAGVRAGIAALAGRDSAWLEAVAGLAQHPPGCGGDDDIEACGKLRELLRQMGRWAVLAFWQCSLSSPEAIDLQGHQETIALLRERMGALDDFVPVSARLDTWPLAEAETPDAFCDRVETVLARSL